MSKGLYWKPVPKKPEEYGISSLKHTFVKRYGKNDGSVYENLGKFDAKIIPFLEGIALANPDMAEDAIELIQAIKTHKEVIITISE